MRHRTRLSHRLPQKAAPKGGGGGVDPKLYEGVCFFFQEGSCKHGDGCKLEHRKLGSKVFAAMPRPGSVARSTSAKTGGKGARTRSPSRGTSPGRTGNKDRPRPKEKAKAAPKSGNRLTKLWCAAFVKGECNKGDSCFFPHLSQEGVNNMKKALDNAKKAGKS